MRRVPTSGVKAHPDGNDYLSDVNTHNSDTNYRSDSEASVDFVASAKNLENGFKYKFRVLRQAYEDRLVNLSQIVETSCHALITEEVGAEMRNDATTLGFLPAHLSEVFSNHLNDERERYLADTLNKLNALEFQVARKNEIVDESVAKLEKMEIEISRCRHRELEVDPMRQRLAELEEQFQKLGHDSKEEAGALTRRNEELTRENHKLISELSDLKSTLDTHSSQYEIHQSDIRNKNTEFMELEKHCHRLEREVSRLSDVESTNAELVVKVRKYSEERDAAKEEIGEYRLQLRQAADELTKCQSVIDEHVRNEEENKAKIKNLMNQVDLVISQEADESTAAIESAHSKIKTMRQQFIVELSEERKVTLSLESQLVACRDELQSRERAIKAYESNIQDLKSKLSDAKDQISELEKSNSTLSSDDRHLKSVNAEYKLKNETLELRIHEIERTKAHEIAQISDQIRTQIQKQYEIEKSQLDMRTSTLRMQFENELSTMQSHFKKSREVFDNLSEGVDRSTASAHGGENLHYLSNIENNNDRSTIGMSKIIEQQQEQAMEVISVINHWQSAASELTSENQVLRKSIEKAGDNIKILRQMLESEKHKCREMQQRFEVTGQEVKVDQSYNQTAADNSGEVLKLRQQVAELQHSLGELRNSISTKDIAISRLEQNASQAEQNYSLEHTSTTSKNVQNTVNQHNVSSVSTVDVGSIDESLRKENEKLQRMYISMQHDLTEKESTIHILEQSLSDSRRSEQAAIGRSSDMSEVANEAQVKALNDMKKRFQGLINTYEMSNTELEDELKAKIEQLSGMQVENEELKSEVHSLQRSLDRVSDERNSEKSIAHRRKEAIVHLRQVIGKFESKIRIEMDEVKRNAEDVKQLMRLLISNSVSENSKNKALMKDAIEAAFTGIEGQKLLAVQSAQRDLIVEHKQHEEALSSAFTTEMQTRSTVYTETVETTKSELISHFDHALKFGPTSHFSEEQTTHHGKLSGSEKSQFSLVLSIKAVLDSLVSVSLIDADSVSEIMQLIASSTAQNNTTSDSADPEYVPAGLFATKIYKLVESKLVGALEYRDTDGSVTASLKNELNSTKDQYDKCSRKVHELTKESSNLHAQLESTKATLVRVKTDISAIKEKHAVELENMSHEMKEKLQHSQREYDSSVQSLRIDYIQKEASLKMKLDEALSTTSKRDHNDYSLLEAKLKSETTKRQSLANRLSAEESAHRNVVQELVNRNADLLRQLEAVELDYTKLKMENLPHRG